MTRDNIPPTNNIPPTMGDNNAELADELDLTLSELCRVCQMPAEHVFALVEEGIVEPEGEDPRQWRFRSVCITRIRCASRLERDLGVNLAGAALALELLEEIEQLKRRLRWLQRLESP